MIEFRNLTKKRFAADKLKKLYKKIFPSGRKGQKKFGLSVVIAPPSLMKQLNASYRGKRKAANVLSFLIAKDQGEIFLNADEKDLPYLFLHGALHLKGYDHVADRDAEKMEKLEQKILKNNIR